MSYTRELVERLMPTIWDSSYAYGMANPQRPDADMPKMKQDPKTSCTLFAHLADIKAGWAKAPLNYRERQAALLRYGCDYDYNGVAHHLGTSKSAAQRYCEAVVGKIAATLNGREYVEEDAE